MIITIRTDTSTIIGAGHVMRCITLAEELGDKGASTSSICREHDGHLYDLIESRGFVVHRLVKRADHAYQSSDGDVYHAPWLKKCIRIMKKKSRDPAD